MNSMLRKCFTFVVVALLLAPVRVDCAVNAPGECQPAPQAETADVRSVPQADTAAPPVPPTMAPVPPEGTSTAAASDAESSTSGKDAGPSTAPTFDPCPANGAPAAPRDCVAFCRNDVLLPGVRYCDCVCKAGPSASFDYAPIRSAFVHVVQPRYTIWEILTSLPATQQSMIYLLFCVGVNYYFASQRIILFVLEVIWMIYYFQSLAFQSVSYGALLFAVTFAITDTAGVTFVVLALFVFTGLSVVSIFTQSPVWLCLTLAVLLCFRAFLGAANGGIIDAMGAGRSTAAVSLVLCYVGGDVVQSTLAAVSTSLSYEVVLMSMLKVASHASIGFSGFDAVYDCAVHAMRASPDDLLARLGGASAFNVYYGVGIVLRVVSLFLFHVSVSVETFNFRGWSKTEGGKSLLYVAQFVSRTMLIGGTAHKMADCLAFRLLLFVIYLHNLYANLDLYAVVLIVFFVSHLFSMPSPPFIVTKEVMTTLTASAAEFHRATARFWKDRDAVAAAESKKEKEKERKLRKEKPKAKMRVPATLVVADTESAAKATDAGKIVFEFCANASFWEVKQGFSQLEFDDDDTLGECYTADDVRRIHRSYVSITTKFGAASGTILSTKCLQTVLHAFGDAPIDSVDLARFTLKVKGNHLVPCMVRICYHDHATKPDGIATLFFEDDVFEPFEFIPPWTGEVDFPACTVMWTPRGWSLWSGEFQGDLVTYGFKTIESESGAGAFVKSNGVLYLASQHAGKMPSMSRNCGYPVWVVSDEPTIVGGEGISFESKLGKALGPSDLFSDDLRVNFLAALERGDKGKMTALKYKAIELANFEAALSPVVAAASLAKHLEEKKGVVSAVSIPSSKKKKKKKKSSKKKESQTVTPTEKKREAADSHTQWRRNVKDILTAFADDPIQEVSAAAVAALPAYFATTNRYWKTRAYLAMAFVAVRDNAPEQDKLKHYTTIRNIDAVALEKKMPADDGFTIAYCAPLIANFTFIPAG